MSAILFDILKLVKKRDFDGEIPHKWLQGKQVEFSILSRIIPMQFLQVYPCSPGS